MTDTKATQIRSVPEPDMRIVDAMCRGVPTPRKATVAERLIAVRHLAGAGFSDRQIGELIGRSSRTVLRIRTAHGIRGLPFGTNGFTRANDWPLPHRNHKK